MRLSTAMIAASAEVRPGGLHIEGGSPEYWTLPAPPPATSELCLVFVAELDQAEASDAFALELWLSSATEKRPPGQLVIERGVPLDFVAGAPLYRPLIVQLPIEFHEVGRHDIKISHEGTTLATVTFGVRVRNRPSD